MNTTKLHDTYRTGTVCVINKTIASFCLPAGSIGVVYENYHLGKDHAGASIIFSNGAYDGFDEDSLEIFEVNPVGQCEIISKYDFSNVGQLSADFKRGTFSAAFMLGNKITKR
jgi:hypothetical protein